MVRFVMGVLLISIFMASSWAAGPTNKVTGDFLRVRDSGGLSYECEITAHEAKDNRTQKGSIYCARTEPEINLPSTWEVMLHNEDDACVVVIDDVVARIGGIVTSNSGNQALGKFFGFAVYDNGEPGVDVDKLTFGTFQFNEESFWQWCEFGGEGEPGTFIHYTLGEGNIQVHFYD